MDKYNYVILGSDWDLYKFSYSDVASLNNVRYVAGSFPPADTLKGIIYRFHFNKKVNRIVNLPGKKLWNKFYYTIDFQSEKPLCFIVFSNWIEKNIDIVSYIRKHHPTAKIVCMMQDLVSTKKLLYTKKSFNPSSLNDEFDLVLSFDQGDCKKYGYTYHPLVFSEYRGNKHILPSSDIYMLAKAKNRLQEIYDIYDVLITQDLKVDLLLVGVEDKDKRKSPFITYLPDKGIAYEENIQHILNTKCILEIMQTGGQGYTQRGCEAVCLGKKLLTNNPLISTAPFYNPNYISTFTSADDIDKTFLAQIKKEEVDIDYQYKENMSPIELLNFIEEII